MAFDQTAFHAALNRYTLMLRSQWSFAPGTYEIYLPLPTTPEEQVAFDTVIDTLNRHYGPGELRPATIH